MTFDITTLDEQTRKDYHGLLPHHPNLGATIWTPLQIKNLDEAHEDHHQNCEECTAGLAVAKKIAEGAQGDEDHDHTHCYDNPNEACYLEGYCVMGKTAFTTWLNALTEYEWQPDFDPEADFGFEP